MGNTKSFYVEGELLKGITIEKFKEIVHEGFHDTYCVAEIVEKEGGYLGESKERGGAYVVAAIHSYSTASGVYGLFKLFRYFNMHRVDWDWSDCWIILYNSEAEDGNRVREWRAHADTWKEEKTI